MRWMAGATAAICLCGPAFAMTLTSADFQDGAALPLEHIYPRCGGQNVAPQLRWSGVPSGTGSLVLTMIDTSVAPHLWSHWVVVDLPAGATALAHGAASLPAPAQGVVSNFGDKSYDGPCPPPGTGVHRYEFTVWAMPPGTRPAIAPDMPADALRGLLSGAARDHATITGTVAAK